MTNETIRETIRLWEEQPEKARSAPAVKGRSDGGQAVLDAGAFSWRADLPAPLGGTNQAPSPTALLLSALAGCAVVFIRDTLAPQLGIRVDAVDATAQCDADARGLVGMAGAQAGLQNVRLAVQVQSPDGDEAVQRLGRVWQERCPIYLALINPMPVALTIASATREAARA